MPQNEKTVELQCSLSHGVLHEATPAKQASAVGWLVEQGRLGRETGVGSGCVVCVCECMCCVTMTMSSQKAATCASCGPSALVSCASWRQVFQAGCAAAKKAVARIVFSSKAHIHKGRTRAAAAGEAAAKAELTVGSHWTAPHAHAVPHCHCQGDVYHLVAKH